METGQAVRQHNKSAIFTQQGALSGLKAWSVDNFSLSPVTEDMVGHFVMDRSYLIQCTYRTEGLDRHTIYFWQVYTQVYVRVCTSVYVVRAYTCVCDCKSVWVYMRVRTCAAYMNICAYMYGCSSCLCVHDVNACTCI